MFKNQKGMSLIQVMVGLGLMSVIGLGVAELMVTSTKVQQRSDVKLSQLILLNEMQSIITSEATCTDMVNSVNQNYNQTQAQSANGWDIKFRVSPGEVYETGHPYGNNLVIERLYLNEDTLIGSTGGINTYRGKLTMDFSTKAETIGGSLQSKEIGYIFYDVDTTNSNKLVGCAKVPDTPANKLCEDMGGEYNFSTKSCSKFKYAGCSNPNMNHGQSSTQNFTQSGRNCYNTVTCIDGQKIETTRFCEEAVAAPPPSGPSGSQCTPPSSRTISGSCPPGYAGGYQPQTCVDGYWVNSGSVSGCSYQSCFTAETTIKLYNNLELPIHNVQVGDYVMGEDGAINEVYDIEVVPLGSRQLFSFNDGPHFVTAEHPFKTTLGWKSFSPEDTFREHFFQVNNTPLEAGDLLYKEGKSVEMLKKISTKDDKSNLMVYNLRLRAASISPYDDNDDRSNTYFANGYLVHNK